MEKLKNKNIDLGNDSISKIFWSYAITSILAVLAQNTAGFVDAVFIGRYIGPEGLSAITLIMPVFMLLGGIGTMVAVGGTTLAGIFKGKENFEKSNNYFNVTVVLLSIVSITSTVFLLAFSGSFSSLLGASGVVAELMIEYSKTLSLFFLPFLLNFAFLFFLKLDGKPVEMVLIVLSGTVINILLDYLFIGVFGWSMKGAALATGVSQLVPCILMIYIIMFKSTWRFSTPVFKMKEIWTMLFNGSSEFLSMSATSVAALIYNVIIIKRIGFQGVAAYAVALQLTTFSTSVFYGFAEANQAAVSFNIGANKLSRVEGLKKASIYANLVTGVILCIVTLMFSERIASIFVKNQATIMMAAEILVYFAVSFILSGVNITVATYYTAVNAPVLSGALAVLRSLIALTIGLLTMPIIFGNSGIWMAVIFTELVTIIVGALCLRKYPYGS
ncbi:MULTISPECIES: MATE family efflux transporter [Alkaliphilus]|uniref:MATE family efflux transporter n=2 Tax=Alkaliphilus TaxID=114627 RepID=A0A833HLB9_9FIRM|nr:MULTISPECIES: MATE family efflux transporter [Alkaliphilus]KAB3525501.1 MATE family efflux transporter [Alkaliphilus serpentinus]KAB3538549.1 MATE family efflux transporter [Alkaliphilus pronyensis]